MHRRRMPGSHCITNVHYANMFSKLDCCNSHVVIPRNQIACIDACCVISPRKRCSEESLPHTLAWKTTFRLTNSAEPTRRQQHWRFTPATKMPTHHQSDHNPVASSLIIPPRNTTTTPPNVLKAHSNSDVTFAHIGSNVVGSAKVSQC